MDSVFAVQSENATEKGDAEMSIEDITGVETEKLYTQEDVTYLLDKRDSEHREDKQALLVAFACAAIGWVVTIGFILVW